MTMPHLLALLLCSAMAAPLSAAPSTPPGEVVAGVVAGTGFGHALNVTGTRGCWGLAKVRGCSRVGLGAVNVVKPLVGTVWALCLG